MSIRAKQENSKDISKYYNSARKAEFIKNYNNGKSENYTWNSIFLRSKEIEESLNKDCCDFTCPEIEGFLKSFNSSSVETLAVKLTLLRKYTDFCIGKGMSFDNQNHYRELKRGDLYRFVDKIKVEFTFYDEEDIKAMCTQLTSARDKYLLMGLFNGIIGNKLEDLINVTIDDLKGHNKVYIKSKDKVITVPDYLYEVMVEAANEYETIFPNGSRWELIGEGVFKPIKSKNSTGMATEIMVIKRLAKLKPILNKPMLGIKPITQSGFYDHLMKETKNKKITVADFLLTDEGEELILNYRTNKSIQAVMGGYRKYLDFLKNKKVKSEIDSMIIFAEN